MSNALYRPLRWSVGVTTAPRNPSTLTETLLSLRDAGWPSATVFADSDMQLGPFRNLCRAAQSLFHSPGVNNAFLIAQDDIQLTPELRQRLEADYAFREGLEYRPTGVVSLYCAAPNWDEVASERFAKKLGCSGGWHEINDVPHLAYGALAYVFSRASIRAFLKWAAQCPTPTAPADYLVGCFCLDSQLAYLTHSPSFVRHTGEVSSLPNPGGVESCRQCKEFLGAAP